MKIVCLIFACLSLLICSCNRALHRIVKSNPVPLVSYINAHKGEEIAFTRDNTHDSLETFTFTTESGQEIIYNQAIRDSSGELTGIRQLNEVVISTKAHNIAERNGIITIGFVLTIPSCLIHDSWQTEMVPVMLRGEDTTAFPKIIVSGKEFKRSQANGYRKFAKYMEGIIPEDASFLESFSDMEGLSIFLERHLPQSMALNGIRNDFLKTKSGVSEKEIIDKYLKEWLIERNEQRKSRIGEVFLRYVKNPYVKGARLDSVIKDKYGNFDYHYSQDVATNQESRKLYLWVKGCVRSSSGLTYMLADSDTITYNVSSVSAFTRDIIRYKKKVIERRVNQRYDSRISFKAGKYKIDPYHNNNANELEKICSMIENVFKENEFEIDSIKIISSSSPEGKFKTNERLSKQRSTEIEKHITDLVIEMSQKYKTLHLHHGKLVGGYGDGQHDLNGKIIQCIIPENWQLLYRLIEQDTILTNKKGLLDCFAEVEPDKRENLLSKYKQEYNYLKENIYPLLRKVSIELNLLRIGMVKDTIHTSEPDTLYTRGVNLLKKREYSKALEILIGYNDINTAIAHLSLGQDVSAYSILEKMEESAHQLYMMAIIHARKGEEQEAARLFLKSKELDIKMAYRGGLDPEISKLIEKYNLNKDLFE